MKWFIGLFVFAGVGLFFFGPSLGVPMPSLTAAPPAPPPVAPAERRDLEVFVESSGDVEPRTQIEVKSEVSGKIASILVKPGDSVERGQILAQIDDRDLKTEQASSQTEVQGAKLVLDQALRDHRRAQQLFERKLLSQEELDTLATKLAVAENDHERAQHRLRQVGDKIAKTVIRAPLDGVVLSVPVSEGQVIVAAASVNAGTLLMSLADLKRKIIRCHINQVDVTKIAPQQPVSFVVSSMRDDAMKGVVERIAPIATVVNNVKGFEVVIEITEENGRLKPGMTADVRFRVAEANGVLTVPISAVFYENDESVVYLKRGEEVERKPVEVGLSNFDYVEIKTGVIEGDTALLVRPVQPDESMRRGSPRAGGRG